MRNTFGNLFTLTTFGESHGIAVGGVIDGFPAGIDIDMDFIQSALNRRRPGQSHITTARKEADQVEFLSGVFEGKSTGTPIGFEVRNQNQHSQDYENMRCLFRPSHADFTYNEKYGIRDHRPLRRWRPAQVGTPPARRQHYGIYIAGWQYRPGEGLPSI